MEQIYIEKLARIQELLEKYPDESFVLNGIIDSHSVLSVLKGICPLDLQGSPIAPVTAEWFNDSLFLGITGEEPKLDTKKYSNSYQITWFRL